MKLWLIQSPMSSKLKCSSLSKFAIVSIISCVEGFKTQLITNPKTPFKRWSTYAHMMAIYIGWKQNTKNAIVQSQISKIEVQKKIEVIWVTISSKLSKIFILLRPFYNDSAFGKSWFAIFITPIPLSRSTVITYFLKSLFSDI